MPTNEPGVPASPLGFARYLRLNRAGVYTLTFSTADRTHAARTSAAVVTSPATSTSPFGWAAGSQADSIITQLNNVRTDLADTAQLVNALVVDLRAMGLITV